MDLVYPDSTNFKRVSCTSVSLVCHIWSIEQNFDNNGPKWSARILDVEELQSADRVSPAWQLNTVCPTANNLGSMLAIWVTTFSARGKYYLIILFVIHFEIRPAMKKIMAITWHARIFFLDTCRTQSTHFFHRLERILMCSSLFSGNNYMLCVGAVISFHMIT